MRVEIWLGDFGENPKLLDHWEDAKHIPRKDDDVCVAGHPALTVHRRVWRDEDCVQVFCK